MSVGPSELVVILLVLFLLFGSRRLADLGKGIGDGIRGFKRGIAGETEADTAAKTPAEAPKEPPQLTGRVATPGELGVQSGAVGPTQLAADPVPVVADSAAHPASAEAKTDLASQAVKPS